MSWWSRRACVFALLIAVAACDMFSSLEKRIADSTTEAVNALDDATDALQSASADWQQVLQDLTSKLTDEAQSTLRNEIANLASRTVAQTGVEFRCDADFLRTRVRQSLLRIKAKFLGQSVPAPEPSLCQVVPVAVDRTLVPARLKQIEFYGYDFDQSPDLGVFLQTASGQRQNIMSAVDRPTHYAMTVRFGANGVQLDQNSSRFILEWAGRPVSTIAVIQPQTPVCETKIQPIDPTPVTLRPNKTRGDREFAGNGPRVTTRVDLQRSPTALSVRVYMRARETRSDYTTAEGTETFPLFTPEPGWEIENIVGPASMDPHTYTDDTETTDSFDRGSGGPVKRLDFVGDTSGDDAGVKTQVTVTFNRLRVELTQVHNCVSDNAVRIVRLRGLLNDAVFNRLKIGLDRQSVRREAMLKAIQR